MLLRQGDKWLAFGLRQVGKQWLAVRRGFEGGSDKATTSFISDAVTKPEAVAYAKGNISTFISSGWVVAEPDLFAQAFSEADPFKGLELLPGAVTNEMVKKERLRRSVERMKLEAEAKKAEAAKIKAEQEAQAAIAEKIKRDAEHDAAVAPSGTIEQSLYAMSAASVKQHRRDVRPERYSSYGVCVECNIRKRLTFIRVSDNSYLCRECATDLTKTQGVAAPPPPPPEPPKPPPPKIDTPDKAKEAGVDYDDLAKKFRNLELD